MQKKKPAPVTHNVQQAVSCTVSGVVCRRYVHEIMGCRYNDKDILPLGDFASCPWPNKQQVESKKPPEFVSLKYTCPKHGDACFAFMVTANHAEIKLGPFCCQCMDELLSSMLPKCIVKAQDP